MWRGITGRGSQEDATPMPASFHGRSSKHLAANGNGPRTAGRSGGGGGAGNDASGGDSCGREGLGRLLQGGMIFVGEQAGDSGTGGARGFWTRGVGGGCCEGG